MTKRFEQTKYKVSVMTQTTNEIDYQIESLNTINIYVNKNIFTKKMSKIPILSMQKIMWIYPGYYLPTTYGHPSVWDETLPDNEASLPTETYPYSLFTHTVEFENWTSEYILMLEIVPIGRIYSNPEDWDEGEVTDIGWNSFGGREIRFDYLWEEVNETKFKLHLGHTIYRFQDYGNQVYLDLTLYFVNRRFYNI
jgi:hypothetical protein